MDIMRIHEMKETLTEWAKNELEKGKECVCTEEMGQVIDMIKDLASAEKDCYEAKYYKSIVEAMEEATEGRAGYDNWRYASGRFAPKGHGHMVGWTTPYVDPYMMQMGPDSTPYRMGYYEDQMRDRDMKDADRMGYGGRYSMNSRGTPTGGRMYHSSAYDNYQMHKRHYTETHDPSHKMKMEESAKEQLDETVDTMKDIWADADPMLRKKMREELSKLISEMPA